jgi:large conductance mechanosensitive channel
MSIVKEFKDFAAKGNVIDLAVGIVIGAAFGKIVSSFVNDVLMPPIGMIIGGVDFKDIKLTLKPAVLDAAGKISSEAVTMNIGNFVQTIFDFIIIAFAVFLLIKAVNRFKRRQEQVIIVEAPPQPKEEMLLTEIRDILKSKS